jgi:sRNA-binding carbon storage regulator CsrA
MGCIVLGRTKGQSIVFPSLSLELRYLDCSGQYNVDRRYSFRLDRLGRARGRVFKLIPNEKFPLASNVWMHVGHHRKGKVHLVIDAPRECTVLRREVYDKQPSPADPTARGKSEHTDKRTISQGASQ